MVNEYYEALGQCGIRYYNMLDEAMKDGATDEDLELDVFICLFQQNVLSKAPLMKMNRWLGYIQGCLIERGYTDVQTERDWTRPLFRPIDFA